MVDQWHEYLRTTANITTNWFFFAGAVNAAVLTWLVTLKCWKDAEVIPWVMIVCNSALMLLYGIFVPLYYINAAYVLADYYEDTRTLALPFPFWLWTFTSVVLAVICGSIATLWWYFFFTTRGKERMDRILGQGQEQT